MNGFYPMLNEVHDKAVKELPLAECALFEHIWRKLIGWNKFEDEISISQLAKETSACRATVITLLGKLEEKRWIVVTRQVSQVNRKFTNKIGIPACPGIKSRLGSIESIPGGSLESRHTTDSPSTDSREGFAQWLTKEFQNCVPGTGWRPESDSQRQRFNQLLDAPKDRLEKIGERARVEGVSARGLLGWYEGGLANYGKLYGEKKGSRKVYRDGHKETIDSLMGLYHNYEGGAQPPDDAIPADSVHTRLRMSLGDVRTNVDELDYSVEAYEALIEEWEGRK